MSNTVVGGVVGWVDPHDQLGLGSVASSGSRNDPGRNCADTIKTYEYI